MIDYPIIINLFPACNSFVHLSFSMGLPSFNRESISDMETFCNAEYHFKCECIICSTDFWMPSTFEVRFVDDELYKTITDTHRMTADALRQLSQKKIKFYEGNALKFLEKYDRFHPIRETCSVWSTLIRMWHVLATRFWHFFRAFVCKSFVVYNGIFLVYQNRWKQSYPLINIIQGIRLDRMHFNERKKKTRNHFKRLGNRY